MLCGSRILYSVLRLRYKNKCYVEVEFFTQYSDYDIKINAMWK